MLTIVGKNIIDTINQGKHSHKNSIIWITDEGQSKHKWGAYQSKSTSSCDCSREEQYIERNPYTTCHDTKMTKGSDHLIRRESKNDSGHECSSTITCEITH